MFKYFALISAFAVFAFAAHLRINPDELRTIWETIDKDIQVRQRAAEEEIGATLVPMKQLVEDAKAKLIHDMNEVAKPYWDTINDLEQQAHAEGHDISRCVLNTEQVLFRENQTLVETHYPAIDGISLEAAKEVERAIQVTKSALRELSELRERVERCSEIDCATQLDIEIVEFYEKIVKDMDGALEIANEAVLIKLPLDLVEQQLNRERYHETCAKLLEDLQECSRERP